jgi:hypothetical protein
MLQLFNVVKVDAVEHQLRGVKPAQALPDALVDLTVVGQCGFPAHAAD